MDVDVECRSVVAASVDRVWARITSPEGINDELMPFMRMTVPRSLRGKRIEDLELGTRAGRSWLLLFGFLPFDYDDIVIGELELGPRPRFLETSSMFALKTWRHERLLRPDRDGCKVIDRIAFEPRFPFSAVPRFRRTIRAMLRFLVGHRHRRLARYFSCPAVSELRPAVRGAVPRA